MHWIRFCKNLKIGKIKLLLALWSWVWHRQIHFKGPEKLISISLFVLVFSDVTGLLYSFQLLVNSKLRDSCSVPLSKAGLDLVQDYLFMCPWEGNAVCLFGSSGNTLILPHSGRKERREVNSGKELTWRETSRLYTRTLHIQLKALPCLSTPYPDTSDFQHFRFKTFQQTRTACRYTTAT